ncbi:hypothetical protein KAU33_01010 [Candidatus Dependentiae bacterium]|nr:hypothetical protein [Candidatus Dependentiae bacterium]
MNTKKLPIMAIFFLISMFYILVSVSCFCNETYNVEYYTDDIKIEQQKIIDITFLQGKDYKIKIDEIYLSENGNLYSGKWSGNYWNKMNYYLINPVKNTNHFFVRQYYRDEKNRIEYFLLNENLDIVKVFKNIKYDRLCSSYSGKYFVSYGVTNFEGEHKLFQGLSIYNSDGEELFGFNQINFRNIANVQFSKADNLIIFTGNLVKDYFNDKIEDKFQVFTGIGIIICLNTKGEIIWKEYLDDSTAVSISNLIITEDDLIIINDMSNIYIYNFSGKLIKKIKIPRVIKLIKEEDSLYIIDENNLYCFSLKSMKIEKEIKVLDGIKIKSFYLFNEYIIFSGYYKIKKNVYNDELIILNRKDYKKLLRITFYNDYIRKIDLKDNKLVIYQGDNIYLFNVFRNRREE